MEQTLVSWLYQFLHDTYPAYYKAIDKDPTQRETVVLPMDDEGRDDGYVHASTLDTCPKFTALERLKVVEREHSLHTYQTMQAGVQMGRFYVEALQWGEKRLRDFDERNDYGFSFTPERYISPDVSKLGGDNDLHSGRLDLLVAAVKGKERLAAPVEVKFTTIWKHGGIAKSHLLQVIAYMKRLQGLTQGRDGHYGFVVTLYNGAPEFDYNGQPLPAHNVWMVHQESVQGEVRYVLCDGQGDPILVEELKSGNGFMTYITETEFLDRVMERKGWYDGLHDSSISLIDTAPYPNFYSHWQCGRLKPPEYYKRGSVDGALGPGALKPGTGTFLIQCPAFHLCFASQLEAVPQDGIVAATRTNQTVPVYETIPGSGEYAIGEEVF